MADYAFSPWIIPHLVAIAVNIFLIYLVLSRNPRNRLNRLCAMMVVVITQWIVGVVFMATATSEGVAEPWVAFLYIGACLIPSATIQFTVEFTRSLKEGHRKFLWLLHLIGLALYPYLSTSGIRRIASVGLYDSNKDMLAFQLYGLWLLAAIAISIIVMGRKYTGTKNMVEKSQLKYMFASMIIAGIFGPMFDVVFPMMGLEGGPIGGSFTTIMAVGFSYAILKYDLFSIEATVEEGGATLVEAEKRLKPGLNYIIKEKNTHVSYEIFRGMVTTVPGICFTTVHPKKLRKEYLLEKTPIIWLTETTTDETNLKPERLEFEILYTIESFIKDNEETIVMLDDLKYFTIVNGFEKTIDFIKSVNDISSMHNGTVLLPLNPMLFEEKELLQLEGLFDESIDLATSGRGDLQDIGPLKESYAYLVESDNPDKMYEVVSKWNKKALGLTKTVPKKLLNKYAIEGMDFYWMTETHTEDEKVLNPKRLDFEVTHTVGEYLREGNTLVVVDCVDLMVMGNDIERVNEFLKSLNDIASVSNSSVIATFNPALYKEAEVALLEKRFDIIIRA